MRNGARKIRGRRHVLAQSCQDPGPEHQPYRVLRLLGQEAVQGDLGGWQPTSRQQHVTARQVHSHQVRRELSRTIVVS